MLVDNLGKLYEMRSAVAAHATELGLGADILQRLLVVATELTTNAVRHGGGSAVVRLWRADGAVYCQVTDEGPGAGRLPRPGSTPPPITDESGHGLWLVNHFSDGLETSDAAPGTKVRARFDLA
jgi:anti-sigma regulatory factor (Ser/Thr protein kinase)